MPLGIKTSFCASEMREASPMRSANLSLIDLRTRIPLTSGGSSWSACANDSSS